MSHIHPRMTQEHAIREKRKETRLPLKERGSKGKRREHESGLVNLWPHMHRPLIQHAKKVVVRVVHRTRR